MTKNRLGLLCLCAFAVGPIPLQKVASAEDISLQHLVPGGGVTITGTKTVNVILMGSALKPGSGPLGVSEAELLAKLDSVHIQPSDFRAFLSAERPHDGQMIRMNADYNIVHMPAWVEDFYFNVLWEMANGYRFDWQTFDFNPDPAVGGPQQFAATQRIGKIRDPQDGTEHCVIENPFLITGPTADGQACWIVTALDFSCKPWEDPETCCNPEVRDDCIRGLTITPAQFLYNLSNPGSPRSLVGGGPNLPQRPTNPVFQNYFIDAPSVEKLLVTLLPLLNAFDPSIPPIDVRNPTIVLQTLEGSPLFFDRSYKKDDVSDADTGFNFGKIAPTPPFSNDPRYEPLPFPVIQMNRRSVMSAWGLTGHNDPTHCPPGGCPEKSRLLFFDLDVIDVWAGGAFVNAPAVPLGFRALPFVGLEPDHRIHPAAEYGDGASTGNLAPVNPRSWMSETVEGCVNQDYFNFDPFGDGSRIWKYRALDHQAFVGDLAKIIDDNFANILLARAPIYDPRLRLRYPEVVQLDMNAFDPLGEDPLNELFSEDLSLETLRRLTPTGPSFTAEKNTHAFGGRYQDVYGRMDEYDTSAPIGQNACGGDEYAATPGYGFLSAFKNINPALLPFSSASGWIVKDPVFDEANSAFGNRIFNFAFGDLFAYFDDHLFDFLEGDEGPYNYEMLNVINHLPFVQGYAGLADNNYADSDSFRQSYVFQSLPAGPEASARRITGYTAVTNHEVGHHLGLAHDHNQVKCLNAATDPTCSQTRTLGFAGTQYGWLADQRASVMSYFDRTYWFGQGEKDAMATGLVWAYLQNNNDIYGQLVKNSRVQKVAPLLQAADQLTGQALQNLLNYQNDGPTMDSNDLAVAQAKQAHTLVLQAADTLGVIVQSPSWKVPYRTPPEHRMETRELLREIGRQQMRLTDTTAGLMQDLGDLRGGPSEYNDPRPLDLIDAGSLLEHIEGSPGIIPLSFEP